MSATFAAFLVLILSTITQYLVTGQFLKVLDRDDPVTFEKVANPVDLVANILGPLRFGLLYMVPKTYDLWELSSEGRRLAFWVRIVTFVSIAAMLWILAQVVLELV